jgi:type I site-specific restriction-modification system R (restriction) subunit
LKLVIVRDMWLTGFDAPCCHTMYVDKPMKGHNLMQAIARVNRVFKNKPGGLVVDYIGIANELKAALKTYTEAKGRGDPTHDAAEALAVLLEKMDIVRGHDARLRLQRVRDPGGGAAGTLRQPSAGPEGWQAALPRHHGGDRQSLFAVRHPG